MVWLLIAISLLVASGILASLTHRRPLPSTGIAMVGAVAASVLGLIPTVSVLRGQTALAWCLSWRAPTGDLLLGLDPLSAFFLGPLLILGALAAVYGRKYMLAYSGRKRLGSPTCLFNILLAAMVMVVLARGMVLFLVAWEAMTLCSYMLVTFDHQDQDVRRAGWVYLVAAHVGEACLIAMMLLLERKAGGLDFEHFQSMAIQSAGFYALIFALAAVGFGIKAGFLPFHVWLPEAHAAAPSHVSALMSGVMIKLGLYGFLRMTTFLPPASWWGPVLMALGLAGALWGISLALCQRDIKRVLAYSSVENMGIITLGLGLAFWRASRGDVVLAGLAACGALLHVWNHVLMKGLMFFSAGSVVHGSGTKDLEKLGGLMKRMPRTGVAMLIGAVAIAGLPPLNGFVGEWLIYFGLMGSSRGGVATVAALLATGLFAFIGSLAALCFVRLIGIVWLGEARSTASRDAHESTLGMTGPMGVLVLGLVGLSLFPQVLLHILPRVLLQLFGPAVAQQLQNVESSAGRLGMVNGALLVGLAGAAGLWRLFRRAPGPSVKSVETWGCGYAAPTARMQYTARSFSELVCDRLFPSYLRAVITKKIPTSLFPSAGTFSSRHSDPLTRAVYEPLFLRWADRFARLRWVQQGALHIYLLYIFVVAVAALAWVSWGTWMAS